MAWLDDRIWAHPKFVALSDKAFRTAISAIAYANGFGTGGRLTKQQQRSVGATAAVRAQLIAGGLWEELDDGTIEIHDWYEHNGIREEKREKLRSIERRRKALFRDPELRQKVRERDADQCRFCGKNVDFFDRKSTGGGTYEHVDPDGENTLNNVVVACRSCSARKNGKPLNQARMTLLPAPLTINADQGRGTDSEQIWIKAGSRPDLDLSSRARARMVTGDRVTDEGLEPQQQVLPPDVALDAADEQSKKTGKPAAAEAWDRPPTDTEVEQAIRSLPGHDPGSLSQVLPLALDLPASLFHDALHRTRQRIDAGSVRNAVGLFVQLLRTASTEHHQRHADAAKAAIEAWTPETDVAEQARSYARGHHPWTVAEELLSHRIRRLQADDPNALLEHARAAYNDELDDSPALTEHPRERSRR